MYAAIRQVRAKPGTADQLAERIEGRGAYRQRRVRISWDITWFTRPTTR